MAAGRSGRLRPTPQATDHLGSALALLTAVRGHVDPAVVMRTLVEDTWRGEVQQPGLLLQVRFEERGLKNETDEAHFVSRHALRLEGQH